MQGVRKSVRFLSDISSLMWHDHSQEEKNNFPFLKGELINIKAKPELRVNSAKERKDPYLQTPTPESSSEQTVTSRLREKPESDCCSQANQCNESLFYHAQLWNSSCDNRLKGTDCDMMKCLRCSTTNRVNSLLFCAVWDLWKIV